MNENQKRYIMCEVIKMLKSFNLEKEDYLERKKDFYDFLFLTEKERRKK